MSNEPAFPVVNQQDFNESYTGMTLRDYFAAQALPAFIRVSAPGAAKQKADPGEFAMTVAANAYLVADAMMKAREQQG